MKKLILFIASAGFLFSSCQKDDSINPASDLQSPANRSSAPNIAAVSAVPTTFLKKILVEEYVGTSYSLVPEANYDLQRLVSTNRDRVFSVGLHFNDPLTNTQTNRLLNALGNSTPTIPSGTIDRKSFNGNLFMDSKSFPNYIASTLARSENCGLAISSTITKHVADIDIHCGFSAIMPGTYYITAYLVEDKVTSTSLNLQQANAFNQTFGSNFYHLGNPILNYTHYNVISKILTNPLGDAINPLANKVGGNCIIHFKTDMPTKLDQSSHLMIISFLTNSSTNEIVNVQQAALGTVKNWN